MAELTAKERLQPALLDRLTDEEPTQSVEARNQRVLSMNSLRRAVLRDLGWLLNSTGLSAVRKLDDYPLVSQSTLNFGFPDYSGVTASCFDVQEVERCIRQAVWDFEPRILRDSLEVQVMTPPGGAEHSNQVVFEIRGELWGQPLPERLYLQTELDLEVGEIKIADLS